MSLSLSSERPKGGRSKRVFYSSRPMRIPEPVRDDVEALVAEFYRQIQRASKLPIEGQWWEVLGVDKDASRQQVRQAYTLLAKLFHTDTSNAAKDSESSKRFVAVTKAYKKSKEHHAPAT